MDANHLGRLWQVYGFFHSTRLTKVRRAIITDLA